MTEGRAVGLVGVLLAAIGALLLLVSVVDRVQGNLNVDAISRILIGLALAVVALLAAVMMYKSRYSTGGLLAVVIGAAIIIVPGGSFSAGILVALGGVLGVVAAEIKK